MMFTTPESSTLAFIGRDQTDRLPTEIADAICAELDILTIACLRLVSHFWNEVATPYLITEIHLLLNAESFDRLRNISEHPLMGSHITSLCYEPEMLPRYSSYDEWEQMICDEEWLHELHNSIYDGDTLCDLSLDYDWDVKAVRQRPRKERIPNFLAEAYEKYVKFVDEQKDLQCRAFGAEDLLQAMCRMPNLTSITMALCRGIVKSTEYAQCAYASALYEDFDHTDLTDEYGLTQARSLLLGACQSGLKLNELHLGYVNAKILQEPDDVWEKFKCCLKHLTTLVLALSESKDANLEEKYGSAARVLELVTAAPKLRHLAFGFEFDQMENSRYFGEVFRAATWPSLQSVALGNIDVSSDDWLSFCNRHSSTLRTLDICDIKLTTGAWVDVFETMRKTLVLDVAEFLGKLTGADPEQCWYLECCDPSSDKEHERNKLSKGIEDYLVRKADVCPLRDVEKYFED